MRALDGSDILTFHASGRDLLVLNAGGEFAHLDTDQLDLSVGERAESYTFVMTREGDEVQVLLEATAITDGEWFPDALDEHGELTPAVAGEMAEIITHDGILPSRGLKAAEAGRRWAQSAKETEERALDRARAVSEVVVFCGGNQSAAARVLGLDQSTVNKLVKKTRAGGRVDGEVLPRARAVR